MSDLKKLAEPLMKWLAENHHPHMKVLIDSGSVELLEGVECINDDQFIRD